MENINSESVELQEETQVVYSNNEVPKELKKWNWGAFSFNIFWGFGNKSYLPLLCFIPVFNLIWMFVCGFKGNSWAWKKGNYKNVDEFMLVQKTWNRAGLAYFILFIIVILIYTLLLVTFIDELSI